MAMFVGGGVRGLRGLGSAPQEHEAKAREALRSADVELAAAEKELKIRSAYGEFLGRLTLAFMDIGNADAHADAAGNPTLKREVDARLRTASDLRLRFSATIRIP